jgi:hypothetical protein
MEPWPQGLVVQQAIADPHQPAISNWKRVWLQVKVRAFMECQVPVLLLPGALTEIDGETLQNVCWILLQQTGSRGAMNAYYVMFMSGLCKTSALTMIASRLCKTCGSALRTLIVARAWGETRMRHDWNNVRLILGEHMACWDCNDEEEGRFWSQITTAWIRLYEDDVTKRPRIRYRSCRNYPLTTQVPMPPRLTQDALPPHYLHFLHLPIRLPWVVYHEGPNAADVPMPRLYIARIPDRLET